MNAGSPNRAQDIFTSISPRPAATRPGWSECERRARCHTRRQTRAFAQNAAPIRAQTDGGLKACRRNTPIFYSLIIRSDDAEYASPDYKHGFNRHIPGDSNDDFRHHCLSHGIVHRRRHNSGESRALPHRLWCWRSHRRGGRIRSGVQLSEFFWRPRQAAHGLRH